MSAFQVPVAVVIPTWSRGDLILSVLERIAACDPQPQEIWVHVDQSDGNLEAILAKRYPMVNTLKSSTRLGPGGGRDACLRKCIAPYAVSFDDDSWPVDNDFFARVVELFNGYPCASVIAASIWHHHQKELPRMPSFERKASFTGCGCAIRVSAYRAVKGYVPRPVAYGLEETDLSLQLFASGHQIYESGELRVFHDTELIHHQLPEVTECVVANIALLAFLRYPISLWPIGLMQLFSGVAFCIRVGRWNGVVAGLKRIPADCKNLRVHRQVLPMSAVLEYLRFRRRSKIRTE